MKLSVIIPTNKTWLEIASFICSFEKLSLRPQPTEVIIVFNGKNRVESKSDFERSKPPHNFYAYSLVKGNANAARNFGARQAVSDLLLFVDDDCLVSDPKSLELLMDSMNQTSKFAGAGGVYKSPRNHSVFGVAYNWISNAWLKFRQNQALVGGFVIYNKSIFLQSGGFNEELSGAAEEVDLNLYLLGQGKSLSLHEEATIEHHFSGGFVRFFSRAFGFGRIRNVMGPSNYFYAPSAVLFGFISSGVLQTRNGYLKLPVVLVLFVAFYFVVLFGRLTALVQGVPVYHRPVPVQFQ